MLRFLKISAPKKIGENIGVFGTNYCNFGQKFDHNIGFQHKRQFLPKICENRRKL
jgi:hypothetical protein